jgi:hypothetical protein
MNLAACERCGSLTSLIRQLPDWKFRGYSSVGRAVALQAIGQGFESPYLQTLPLRLEPRGGKVSPDPGLGDGCLMRLPQSKTRESDLLEPVIGPVAQLVRACA